MTADPASGAKSLRSRLTLVLIGIALLSVVLVSIVGVRLIRQATERAALTELDRQARAISAQAAFLRSDPVRTVRFLRALNLSGAALYEIQPDGSLAIVAGNPDVPITRSDVQQLASGNPVTGRRSGPLGDHFFVARPVQQGSPLLIVLGRQVSETEGVLPVGRRLLLAAAIAIGVAALVSYYVSSRISRPMHELASAASDVARGNFGRRVTVDSDDEIGVLASSFNSMAEELGTADQRQREFFLSISHELRTPLTAIQGYAEAIEDGTASQGKEKEAAGVIVSESKRLTRLVSDLLDLARIDARRFNVSVAEVNLFDVLSRVSAAFAPQAAGSGVEIEVVSPPLRLRADQDRLVQVLSNLVENALRYTPTGSRITIAARSEDDNAVIEVTDGGLGLEADDFEHAFDRQYLWQKYRGIRDVGTGLGLAITKELVEAMGGTVLASNAAEGGARFTIVLPQTT